MSILDKHFVWGPCGGRLGTTPWPSLRTSPGSGCGMVPVISGLTPMITWQDFNWHRSSLGASAIAKFLIALVIKFWRAQWTAEDIRACLLMAGASYTWHVYGNRQHCAQRNAPVFNLLRGRFWGFSPRRGNTLHRWGWNMAWRRGPLGDQRSTPPRQISPHRGNDKGVGPPKLNFLLRFDQYVEYKRPSGAYPLSNFHKICSVCTPFQDALAVKIRLDLLEGLWSYGGFKLRGSGYPKFSPPLAAKLCIRPQKF